MGNLPDDVMEEILSRVPAKSLLRFRCVCKTWNKLTYNSIFIELHLNRAMENNYTGVLFSSDCIIPVAIKDIANWVEEATRSEVKTCLYSVERNSLETSVQLEAPPFETYYSDSKFVGSCNGIVCIMRDNYLCLVNPCSREYKIIKFEKRFERHSIYGFGYDDNDKDFKLIEVNDSNFDSWIIIRSISDTSCLTVPGMPSGILVENTCGVYLNGALHWIARKIQNENTIMTFDIRGKYIQELMLPYFAVEDSYKTLCVLGGCLSILGQSVTSDFEVWAMSKYGDHNSWSKLFSIDKTVLRTNVPFSRPLCFSNEGEILLNSGTQLVAYNPQLQTVKNVKCKGLKWFDKEKVTTYVESLVPLKSNTYLETFVGFKLPEIENRGVSTVLKNCMECIVRFKRSVYSYLR